MRQHVENTQKVAEFLESHPKVLSVSYPGLESSKYHELAENIFPRDQGQSCPFG
jgi:O-acetylhomoserine (thiol)-lyase